MLVRDNDKNKDLKDPVKDIISVSDFYKTMVFSSVSYTKINKLITALYMVTDIIDRDEPLRNKLRTLGTGIISDMYVTPFNALYKIYEIMSFLDIACTINIISKMNCNILLKEFTKLDQSIKESSNKGANLDKQINLSEFLKDISPDELPKIGVVKSGPSLYKGHKSIGHVHSTRIGVQKGSTLMKALSDKTAGLSNSNFINYSNNNFDILKKQRRYEIINTIKNNGESATIKDIKTRMNTTTQGTLSFSEKTLQRELMSMTKDGVLSKTGEKRWSRYKLVNPPI